MSVQMGLDRLQPLQRGIVMSVGGEEAMKRRLEELGIIRGTVIECVMISPLGDPVAYRIRGSVVALRRKDAAGIMICPYGEANDGEAV